MTTKILETAWSLLVCLLFSVLWSLPINAQTTTDYNISDDGWAHVPLEFPFPYYGQVFTDSFFFSNGVVGFMSPMTSFCCNGENLNYSTGPTFNYSIMPLWTDLINDGTGSFSTTSSSDSMLYSWDHISEYGTRNYNTFGLQINQDGSYTMSYDEINVQNHGYTIGATGNLSLGEYTQYEYAPNGGRYTDTTVGGGTDMCALDPLYDVTCAGYEQAYMEAMCLLDPLYNQGCPGYGEAYLTYNCNIDPLYDTSCVGYGQAYHDLQCSIDPLYDTTCSGYQVAYDAWLLSRTCLANTQSDPRCEGYVESSTQTVTNTIVDDSPILPQTVLETIILTPEPVVNTEVASEATNSTEEQTPTEEQASEQSAAEEAVGAISIAEEKNTSTGTRQDIRRMAIEKAKDLATQMSAAATIEAQKAAQAQVLALMNYLPGFDAYGITLDGGSYQDNAFYDPTYLPETRTGLRNGLAQQILHEKMVDMQYNRTGE